MDPYQNKTGYTASPISGAILCYIDTIVDQLRRVDEVILGMFTAGLVSMDEKQQLEREGNNMGNNAKIRLLLQLLLKKPEATQERFLEIVNDKGSQAVASLIYHHVGEVRQGQMPEFVNEAKLKDYIGKLKVIYCAEKKWNTVEAVPGVLSIDLLQKDALIKPLFKVEMVDSEPDMAGFIMHQGIKYKKVDVQKPEDVFNLSLEPVNSRRYLDNKTKDLNENTIICTGNPGVGKTTFCKMLLMQWAKGDGSNRTGLFKYKLVFYIPVREVQHERIVDILDNFLLVDDYCRPFLHWVLTKFAGQVLFLLDGFDEVEITKGSELWKLIQNKLYDGCTVLLTSRQDAKILHEMGFYPNVKIFLEGIDAEDAKIYMHKYMNQADNKDITELMHLCKAKLDDSKLLQIPMYVVFLLFSISYDGHENNWDVVTVPETLTDLLSSFLVTLVKRWLFRLDRSDKMVRRKGSRNLLDRNSTVPVDIKRILFLVGKLCYESTLSGKYEFSEDDIRGLYLGIDELGNSGLFIVSNRREKSHLSVMHRIVHEYLAGMYIANEKFGVSTFAEIITDSYFVFSLGQRRLLGALQFAVGTCPNLLEKILEAKLCSHRVLQSSSDGSTDIYYETSLLGEANERSLYQKFISLLRNAERFRSKKLSFVKQFVLKPVSSLPEETVSFATIIVYQKYMTKLVKELDTQCSVSLLAKFYNVVLEKSASNEFRFKFANNVLVNTVCKLIWWKSNTLSICLDQLSAELLAKLVVRDVHKLEVRSWNRAFMDLSCIIHSLPDIRIIDIIAVPIDCNVIFPPETCELVSNNDTIERISLFSAGEPCIIPKDAICAIAYQKSLRSLTLLFCDILLEAENFEMISVLQQLEEVVLFDNVLTGSKLTTFCSLIRSCTKLRKLTLWAVFTETVDISPFVQQIRSYACLEMLSIHIGPSQNMIHLARILPQLRALKTFSVQCQRIASVEEDLVKCLSQCSSLQTLTVWDYDGELKPTGYCFPENLQKRLQSHHIELVMKTPGMLEKWQDFLQLYHDF